MVKDDSAGGEDTSGDTMLDVASLKVAELKEELGKRGLPTNGLKKDLASRLQEALDEGAKVEGEAPAAGEEPAELVPVSGEAGKEDAIQSAVGDGTPKQSKEDTSNQASLAAEKEEIELEDETGLNAASEVAEAAEDESNTVSGTNQAIGGSAAEVTGKTESLADRLGEKSDVDNTEEVELGGDIEIEMGSEKVPKTSADEIMPNGDAPSKAPVEPAAVEPEAMEEDEKKLTSYHPGGLSPHDDPPSTLLAEATSSAKALADLDEQSHSVAKASRSLCVVGLVRPLTIASFRSRVEEFGPVEEVWLDGVKTHAYVTYQTQEAASQAKAAMSGTVYPPDTGKEISVHYIPESITKNCIAIEELAWQEERGKMELRARISGEDGGSLLYSLHRLDNVATSRLESTLPAPSASSHRGPILANRIHSHAGTYRVAEAPTLEWGAGSSSSSFQNRSRDAPRHSDARRGPPPRQDRHRYNGRSEHGSRGPSRADDRVREVEARIMAERERGIRGPPREATEYQARRAYDRHPPPRDDRWARDADRGYDYGGSRAWNSGSDRRSREYSPPAERRAYAEKGRDEFGRDRF